MSKSNQAHPDILLQKGLSYQSSEEIEEILLQELESLFDKPCLIPMNPQSESQRSQQSSQSSQQTTSGQTQQTLAQPTSFTVGFEKDYSNTFLVTNPQAIFKVFAKEQFLLLSESSQCILLDRLDDILQKCSHNSLILTDHLLLTNVTRLNQHHIADMVKRSRENQPQEEESKTQEQKQRQSVRQSNSKQFIPEHDILLLFIQLCMKVAGKHPISTKKLIDLIRKLTYGKRFLRCHLEYIYQFLKIRIAKLCQSSKSTLAMQKLDTAIKVLVSMFEQRFEVGPSNYFYFSGFLSGIHVNTKTITHSEFIKGFTACMWFQLQENALQDDRNLPVLFNVFFQGHGGFECYFNQRQLFYRMLGKAYSPPTVESNGILIGEFQPKKWYFFATEHEKPSFTRPQFTAIINDKQVATLPLDYPKIDKNAKVSTIAVCKNFVGLLSSFILFKEPINNSKKLIQVYHLSQPYKLYNHFEYGFYSNQQLSMNPSGKGSTQVAPADIFDQKMIDKLLLLYSPERTSSNYNHLNDLVKTIYDCVDMRDAELMINSGACTNAPKPKSFFTGGLLSFLPLLDLIRIISLYQEHPKSLDNTVNEFLKLVNAVMSSKSYSNFEQDQPSPFFTILFHLLGKLPSHAVNSQTIQLLAEIRFQIGESKLQEQFFSNLMQSSDFWLNTDNIEVINEFWQFVKAIYSQNPIQYNRIFSIQNLIDLMVKISDLKDAGHCCEYHRSTYMMFYQGQIQQYGRPSTLGGIIPRERNNSNQDDSKGQGSKNQDLKIFNSGTPESGMKNNTEPLRSNIHQIDKYLAPIAGVLEGVLTTGGNEVLEQIQFIAKSLTVKSSPCFHLHMLKLLKVLLLDIKDGDSKHCASPGDFAASFLKANGLQVLLYLCSNSSFDVKAMCVKLIDVLSSHTSLIKVAIDPDVITYLCNFILPRSMMENAFKKEKSQIFNNISTERMIMGSHSDQQMVNQYELMESNEALMKEDEDEDNDDVEAQMNQLLMKDSSFKNPSPPKKFGSGLFMEDDEEESEAMQEVLALDQRESVGAFQKDMEDNELFDIRKRSQYEDDDLLPGTRPPPPAPRSRSKATMQFDFQEPKQEKNKFNQTSKAYIFGKQQTIDEVNEDSDEEMKSEDQGSNNDDSSQGFGMLGFSKKLSQKDKKMQFMNTQKIPSFGKSKTGGTGLGRGPLGKALALTIDDNDEEEFQSKRSVKGTRNTFAGQTGKKASAIQFAECDDNNEDEKNERIQPKKKDSFANENVMSKSNLRQPKSFNFGFPDSDSEEEKGQGDEEEKMDIVETNDDIPGLFQRNLIDKAIEEDDIMFEDKARDESDDQELILTSGAQKSGSLILPSSKPKPKSNQSTAPRQNESEQMQVQPKKQPASFKKKGLFLGGTTGATQDMMFEEPQTQTQEIESQSTQDQAIQRPQQQQPSSKKAVISFQKNAKIFTNANNKLNIDTDAINELFTYGGEHGQVKMSEDEEIRNFENEIEELASMCIAAMNRKTPSDPIKYEIRTKQTFETKFLNDKDNDNSDQSKRGGGIQNPRAQFMTPQSVRGIKKIGFSISQDDKSLEGSKDKINLGGTLGSQGLSTSKAFGLKTGMFSNNTILEELSPASNSKSSSTKLENLGGNSSGETFSKKEQKFSSYQGKKLGNDKKVSKHLSFNQTQPHLNLKFNEPIVQGKKMSKKRSSDLIPKHETLVQFGTSEEIGFDQEISKANDDYTSELENLYTSCLEWIISRAPSSLYENIVIDEVDKIGYQPAIQLLMTLVTYSNNLIRQRALNDLEMLAKWDPSNGSVIMVHPQFHQWLLELLMPYQDFASKYSNLQGTSQAVYDIGCKLHTILLKNASTNSEEEVYKRLNFLVRWPMIVQQQAQLGIKERNERDVQTSHKLSRVLIQQLLTSLKDDTMRVRPQISKNNPTWQNMIYTIFLVEELIFGSHQKALSGDNFESNRDVNVSLLRWIQKDYLLYYNGSNEKSLWAEWEIIEQVFGIIDSIYPEWMRKHEQKSASNSSIEEFIFNTLEKLSADEFTTIVDVLMHEGSPYKVSQPHQQPQYPPPKTQSKAKGFISGVLGGKSSQSYSNQQQEQIPPQQQANINSEQSFMRNLLNILCIALVQSDTKALVQTWLERFEKFIKYIMIISETWRSRLVNTVYNNYQKKFADCISFAFTFLFHEIHQSQNQAIRNNFTVQASQQHSNTSSPKEQMFNKLYAQCLKNLMIYYINILEYQKIRFTPLQLESHVTACRLIFNSVLIKTYQGGSDSLISLKDISRFKQSDYDDFPECFYMEDWKFTFFNSDIIKNIVKRQINQQHLWAFIQRRKNYAQYYLETQTSNDKTKDEILKRMQGDIVEVISQLSTEEFERKNKVALMNENFIREQCYHWKKAKQVMFGNRGIWRVFIGNEEGYLKSSLFKSNDGVRPCMLERFRNGFEYLEPDSDLEKKIFGQVDSIPSYEIFNIDKKQQSPGKQQLIVQDKKLDSKKRVTTNSDDDDYDKDDEEEEFGAAYTESSKQPIISFFSKTLSTRDKISLRKQYINHLKEYIYTFRIRTKEIISDMKVAILKPFYQRPGCLTLTSHDILFFDDLFTPANLMQEKDNIFFFKYQKKQDDLLYKIIPLQNLKELQRRRFLGRKTGLEIFLMDNKSLLLNFQSEEERNLFATKIIRQRSSRSYNLKYSDSLEPRKILKKRELTEKWAQWKISNFDYIMQLNYLAGRSFNDLSQYPVFPWILMDFTSNNTPDITAASLPYNQPHGAYPPPQGFRDLNKNMQLLGTAERQAEFKRKYDDSDSFASAKEKFHCGSHYSNPGIVLHYLSRLSPYIDALVELHGKNLDTPDRGFHSIQDSLNSALTDHADVRELVPEFYFCPEMFLNLNHIKFGVKQDGNVVDNVRLPQWCNGDPYLFVIFLREAFESNYVSYNLSSWIDYIFGYKQRDQEAERSLNTFSHLTYEDGIDIDSVTDQLMRQSYQEQIYNYGQTPSQLFQRNKHQSKLSKIQALKYNLVVDTQAKIKVYKPVNSSQASKSTQSNQAQAILLSQEAILKAKFVDDQTIVGISKDGTVTYFFWLSKAHELNPNTPFTCCEDKKRKFDNRQKQNGFEAQDRSIKKFDFPLLILNNQKCIMRGGFWGGKVQICPIEGVSQEQSSYLTAHSSTVTAIVSTLNEKIVITGSKSGDICVWNYVGGSGNPSHESNWQLRKQISDHEGMISTIHINEEMCLYLTCSFDGTANIYNLWTDKFFRSFQHPKLAPIHCGILTQTPLPSICFFSREDHYWQSFSLNGHFLDKQKEDCSHIISPQVVKDSHFMDKLVYGTEKGYLIFRQLPLLKQTKKQQVSTSQPVLSIIVSPDRRFLLVGCGDGGLNVVTEPFQINQGVSQTQTSNISSATTSSAGYNTAPSTSLTTNPAITQSLVNMSQSVTTSGSQQQKSSFGQSSSGQNTQSQMNQLHQYRE